MNHKLTYIALLLIITQLSFAQDKAKYKVWNPANDTLTVLEGQGWPKKVKDYYDRLPAKAEGLVRSDVWNLSKNNAGVNLRFRTNSNQIIVKYAVKGNLQMSHMPATGVSGVDLYAKDRDGKWLWSSGSFSFGDTITYRFNNLAEANDPDREYTLYLPLYNSLKWLEIYVPNEKSFAPMPLHKEKPIVVYGTSIAQGACATRPGLAWTSILQRKLDQPLINLGFSGNGRLEKELINLLTEIDAKLYVLDCLPNLTGISKEDLMNRIETSVLELQNKRPGVPILLTEHDGYTDELISPKRKTEYEKPNLALNETFKKLQEKGVKNIYLLSKKEIGQDIESMVDGVHPNDIGMMNYANAYEKIIKKILNQPEGNVNTAKPISQYRELPGYDWEKRHNQVLIRNKINPPQLVFMGNSITHFWAGEPLAHAARGTESWDKYFKDKNPINMGFGWDRIENVLWRVYHGELDGFAAKQIVLMIGTNNLQSNSDEEIADGLKVLIEGIKTRQPDAKILVLGILPRKEMEPRIVKLNLLYAKVAQSLKVKYADAGNLFLNKTKKVNEILFTDGLHPNAQGYEKLGAFINKQITNN
ncbi:SGNH/GDSL hydrolase family protein [Pedobacter sp. B4-66]|uniref:SGNH/GDSL hydrolase family protein n=1 Tax=Pedobacter sp. B4-66 TaxID=2817280 RepID=UPI001BD9D06C|nr:SGNH/GDSL hydrolase family protein [Pedobacter sp. B4-66]